MKLFPDSQFNPVKSYRSSAIRLFSWYQYKNSKILGADSTEFRFSFGTLPSNLVFQCSSNTKTLPICTNPTKQPQLHQTTPITLTLSTLTLIVKFSTLFSSLFPKYWQRRFVWQSGASQIDYHFLHSRDLYIWFNAKTVRSDWKPNTLKNEKVKQHQLYRTLPYSALKLGTL